MAEKSDITTEGTDTFVEKGSEEIHARGSSSSSSSDSEVEKPSTEKPSAEKPSAEKPSKVYRLFGREKPVHKVLGGGKSADIFLWRNKKVSGGALAGATVMWILFELMDYHLLTLVCHIVIASLAVLFLWANVTHFIHKSPPRIPEIHLKDEQFQQVARDLRNQINWAFSLLHDVASGRDLKTFLSVMAGLWVLSIVGSWCNFLTLFYIVFVLVHTVPALYEKYEDKVDPLAEKAMAEIRKQYVVFDAKVLSKIPRGPLKNKKA